MASPFADLSLASDRSSVSRNPRSVLIRQRGYMHDVALVTIDYETKTASKYATGQPVLIEWGWLPDDTNTFYGYVHHSRQNTSQQQANVLQVYCIGSTYRMNQPYNRSFIGQTTAQIAAQIAGENGFSLTVTPDPYVWPQLAQAGRSDWKFLTWVAKRRGCVLFGGGTDLSVLTRAIDSRTGITVPTFTVTPGKFVVRNACYTVSHAVGDSTPGTDRRSQTMGGVTDSGDAFAATVTGAGAASSDGTSASTDPIFSTYQQDRPASSVSEAQAQLAGAALLTRFGSLAEVTTSGNTAVHQGSTIRLVGTDDDSDGLWYVGSVDHHITVTDYRCSMTVGRDALGDNGSTTVTSITGASAVLGPSLGVGVAAAPVSATIYNPVSAAVPVETAVLAAQTSSPLGIVPTNDRGQFRSVAAPHKVIPYRTTGGDVNNDNVTGTPRVRSIAVPKPPANLGAWRATTTAVRTPA